MNGWSVFVLFSTESIPTPDWCILSQAKVTIFGKWSHAFWHTSTNISGDQHFGGIAYHLNFYGMFCRSVTVWHKMLVLLWSSYIEACGGVGIFEPMLSVSFAWFFSVPFVTDRDSTSSTATTVSFHILENYCSLIILPLYIIQDKLLRVSLKENNNFSNYT